MSMPLEISSALLYIRFVCNVINAVTLTCALYSGCGGVCGYTG